MRRGARAPRPYRGVLVPRSIQRSHCIICDAVLPAPGLFSDIIGRDAIIALFVDHGILLNHDRCYCNVHRHNGAVIAPTNVQQLHHVIPTRQPNDDHNISTYNRSLDFIKRYQAGLRDNITELEEKEENHQCSISIDKLSEKQIRWFCRLSRTDLINLSTTFDVDIHKLFIFYTKCYRDPPYRFMSGIFGLSKSTLSLYFHQVLTALTAPGSLVETELNQCWTRDAVLENTPDFIQELWDLNPDRIAFITDGTHFGIQKPGHFNRQKRSWAVHKAKNTVNVLPIIAPNGKYVLNLGPWHGGGDNSDEYLFKSVRDTEYIELCRQNNALPEDERDETYIFDEDMVGRCDHLNKVLYRDTPQHDGDVMFADRGFGQKGNRDIGLATPDNLNDPKKRGRVKSKRKIKKKKRKQLPLEEVNRTRLVTFVRHTIERCYGRLKGWKIVAGVILWQFVGYLRELIDVLMATENRYFPLMLDDDPTRLRMMRRIRAHQNVTVCEVAQHVPLVYAERTLKV